MIERVKELEHVDRLLKWHRIVGIIGARQVGKTTLARAHVSRHKGPSKVFDLENPEDLARLQDPMLALKRLKGLVVIDEIQRLPDLFETIRVLADRPRSTARFLVLGSASPKLLKQGSETLAGRIVYHELGGLGLDEVGNEKCRRLWLRGGFPPSYTARSQAESTEWRRGFIRTFLERDLPQLGIGVSATTMRRFWQMLAHYHGQLWNASEFGRSFGVADTTVRSYLDLLTSALVVRQISPWHENISKRQVKAPKVYVNDSGIHHALLNLRTFEDLESHPKVGASWEGFVVNQITRHLGADSDETYFWATHGGAELDLLVIRGRQKLGFEVKLTSSPRLTRSMQIAMKDLKLNSIDVIHAGEDTYEIGDGIRAVALGRILKDLKPLR
jgi:predicted AAA+ superfamily ATPase